MAFGSITINPQSGAETKQEFQTGDVIVIGRRPAPEQLCILLDYPDVSEKHAEICCHTRFWTIKDLRSTNGTKLNGERLSPGLRYRLESGDRLAIADHELLVNSCPLYEPEPGPQVFGERMYNI